ncbi:MAG: hypothetical protein HY901_10145 [Deltaproteobacteria bacterium]|nr:hypothetical protein [Deltaproteobacteria bacterium]
MTTAAEYPYARGDLLDKPHTYFYTPFQGADFFPAWERSRAEALAGPAGMPGPVGGEASNTGQFLTRVEAAFQSGEVPAEVVADLERLLRNFEAKKRIYEAYDANFTSKNRTDFRQLGLYIRFGDVMALAYTRWGRLPYLNALIKGLDILCAARANLSDGERLRLAGLVRSERGYVSALAAKLGVGDLCP